MKEMDVLKNIGNWFVSIGLKDWEQWSFVAVIFTLFVNTGFFIALIVQIRQGRKTLTEAQLSTKAAEAAVREARRARIDEQAPRVVAILEKPLMHGLRTGNSFSANSDAEYIMPKMKDDKLFVITEGELINEGKGTARVRLNGSACFIDDSDDEDFYFAAGEITPSEDERMLRPGEKLRFAWSDGHTLDDWTDAYTNSYPPNPRGACFMEVVVRDYLEDGVADNIYLEMAGRPLVPVEGDSGRWKYGEDGSLVAVSYPNHRTYRQEGIEPITPPWAKSYEEWNSQYGAKAG